MTGTAPDDAEAVRRILQQRADALARPPQEQEQAEMVGLLGLVVGSERYGVQLGLVVGIEPLGSLAPMPATPTFWTGLSNVHGTLYPVLELREYLGLPSTPPSGGRKVVLVSAAGISVGLVADDVSDVTWVRRDGIGARPAGARDRHAGVTGVTPDLMAVLDLELLLADPALVVDHDTS